MSRHFRYYLRVRYSECDGQKVVFHARYDDYVGLAISEFLRAAGLQHDLHDGNLSYQIVKQTIEWKAPARYDQVLELAVSPKQIGNTSFTMGTEIRVADREALLATAETVLVLINERTMKKVTLFDDHREALSQGAPGAVTDHAGYLAGGHS
ncbi:MAG TPA: acyl-CoA thioesterase [Geobacter sp.]|nr:acyl-CoA thioesterase [Geobacter sp.]